MSEEMNTSMDRKAEKQRIIDERANISGDLTTDTWSTSSLYISSEGGERWPSSASSFHTAEDITEAAEMLVQQETEQAAGTLRADDSASRAKKPAGGSFFKNIKRAWKTHLGKKLRKEVTTVSECQKEQDEDQDQDLVTEIYLPPGPSEGTEVQRWIQTHADVTAAGGVSNIKREELKRPFSARLRQMIHPLPVDNVTGAVRSAITDLTPVKDQLSPSLQGTSSTTSSSAVPETDPLLTLLELEDYTEVEDITPDETVEGITPDETVEDITPDETRNVVSSEHKFLEDPPAAEAGTDDIQDEMSASSPSQSKDSVKRNGFFSFFRNIFS